MTAPVPVPALAAFLAVFAVSRLWELARSARNGRALAARGAIERGRGQLPWFVALHALFPVLLTAEVVVLGARPGPAWPLWLTLLAAAEGLRGWVFRTLGARWTAAVWVVPGELPVRRGPYRVLRHPNYLGVALELAAAPLMFGAWRTALAVGVANAILLTARVRVEERAWGWRPAARRGHPAATASRSEGGDPAAGTGSSARTTSSVRSSWGSTGPRKRRTSA